MPSKASSHGIPPEDFIILAAQTEAFFGHIAEQLEETGIIHLEPKAPPFVIISSLGVVGGLMLCIANLMQEGKVAVNIRQVGHGHQAHNHYELVILNGK